tara:strand:- start:262 stop:792 length:531 start_codon:yes stop_codon:yes gene_type:complete
MRDKTKDLELNQEEIDAISKEMASETTSIDRFFLLKLHTIILLCLYFSSQMFFFPQRVTFWLLVSQEISPDQLASALAYRGVFILSYLAVALFSWRKNRYTELVFGSATIMAFTNTLLDLPYLVTAEFSAAPASFAFGILLRVMIITLLVSIFRNLDRASYLQGNIFANPFAPLRM